MTAPQWIASLGAAWTACVDTPNRRVLVLVVGANLALTLYTALVTLRDFPNSADEYSYFVSAELFSRGLLSVPSPEPREAFGFYHIINNGRYYGRYTPGWPAFLSVGMLVGVPWLVNAACGALTVVMIHLIGSEFFSPRVANLSVCACLANSFQIFNAASYFAHTSCLLFLSVAAYCALRVAEDPALRLIPAFWGLASGAAFAIRPATALAVTAPFLLYVAFRGCRSGRGALTARSFGIAAGPATACLALYLGYNFLQTGSPWLHPFTLYNDDHFGLGPYARTYEWAWANNVVGRLRELNRWFPCSVYLLLAVWLCRDTLHKPAAVVVQLSFWSLFGTYYFWLYEPGNQYGPRYIHEGLFVLALTAGSVLGALGRAAPLALVWILSANIIHFHEDTARYASEVNERMKVYDLVRDRKIQRAIVFLKTGSGTLSAQNLTRNGIDFDRPVIYVLDRGKENDRVIRKYGDRDVYYYFYDERSRVGTLSPAVAEDRP